MSADPHFVTNEIPTGKGWALDVGGGGGILSRSICGKGYRYVNLDLRPGGSEYAVRGDAHRLPFTCGQLSLVVSKDSLEHFEYPDRVISEIRRVLADGGLFVLWVPFMHPFHGSDYWRFSELGLRKLLRGFEIQRFDSPLWVFSVMSVVLLSLLKPVGLGWLGRPLKKMAAVLDHMLQPSRRPRSFAAAYLVTARATRSLDREQGTVELPICCGD